MNARPLRGAFVSERGEFSMISQSENEDLSGEPTVRPKLTIKTKFTEILIKITLAFVSLAIAFVLFILAEVFAQLIHSSYTA